MEIQSLEDLDISKILKTARKNSKEFDFKPLAEEIMNKICISNGAYKYHPIEIEFYIYDKEEHADIHVYPRTAKAGKLFFHLSGMDICFESSIEDGRFGGILIRALEREKKGDEPVKLLGGPLTCVNEVLNTATQLIKVMCSKSSEELNINCFGKRKGINKYAKKKDDYWDAKYRFIREGITNPIEREDETFDFGNAQVNAQKIKKTRYYKIEEED